MATTIIICATVIICVMIAANADITINIKHTDSAVDNKTTIADIQEVYDKVAKEEKVPDFGDIINAINEEFGGIDYGTQG